MHESGTVTPHHVTMPLGDSTVEFIAGTVGGWAQVVVGHPFDTIKVRMQTQKAGQFSGPLDCLRKSVKYEGVFSFTVR